MFWQAILASMLPPEKAAAYDACGNRSFEYASTEFALAIGTQAQATIAIDNDSDFLVSRIDYISDVTNPIVECLWTMQAGDRTGSNRAISIHSFMNVMRNNGAVMPLVWNHPDIEILLPASTRTVFDFTDRTSPGNQLVTVALRGMKVPKRGGSGRV